MKEKDFLPFTVLLKWTFYVFVLKLSEAGFFLVPNLHFQRQKI